jgi:hypothetical protein
MLKGHMIRTGLLAGLCIVLLGCAGNLPQPERADLLQAHWGKSLETAKNNQILNPEAGKDPTPVEGLDGKAANDQMDKYRKALQREQRIQPSVGIGQQVKSTGMR